MCRAQRDHYSRMQSKARTSPQSYASLIIDGMDARKTRLPRMAKYDKLTAGLGFLRSQIVSIDQTLVPLNVRLSYCNGHRNAQENLSYQD